MNTNKIARDYGALTPFERFCLISAAGDRNDEAEQERLIHAGQRITLSMPDHSPYLYAFTDICWPFYNELVEEAARFQRFGEMFSEAMEMERLDRRKKASRKRAGGDEGLTPVDRTNNLWFAAGYKLKTEAGGWNLHCERMGLQPYTAWAAFPGLNRLVAIVQLADKMSFVEEGMVNWLNSIRPDGEPEATNDDILTIERVANTFDIALEIRARWWGAEPRGEITVPNILPAQPSAQLSDGTTAGQPPDQFVSLMSAPDIARVYGITNAALESELRRLREKYPDCYLETESGRRKNDPRYLYRLTEIWHVIERRRNES